MLRIGLNPYGLTYTLGLQGLGTSRANPDGLGLVGFVDLAREIRARCIEFDWRWLTPLDDGALARIAAECVADGMTPIVSAWLRHAAGETLADPIRVASLVGARLLRLHLTPVLEGARARLGSRWPDLVAHARRTLEAEAPRAAAAGLDIGLEDHQDLGSEDLLDIAEAAGDHVGIVFDTGNPFAVGEDPVAFARRALHRIRHLHLKDYRAQFTTEGVRLVRCAIGDGCVPLEAIVRLLGARDVAVTASLEPAALEARHIRFFTPEWWTGYRPRAAAEFGEAIGRLRDREIPGEEDVRTPWERRAPGREIVAYERAQLDRSVSNMRARGWM
jgi:sugar phosphate isomerase/epimerase